MLPQQDIDSIIYASRACDEGPTQLARRIESAAEAAERERWRLRVIGLQAQYNDPACREALKHAADYGMQTEA